MNYLLRDVAERLGIEVYPNEMIYCPFHNDTEPSCWVKGTRYHCFGCHKHGDAFSFVQSIKHWTYYEAKRFLESGFTEVTDIVPSTKETRKQKIRWTRNIYRYLYGLRNEKTIRDYFENHKVIYHPEMGCITYTDKENILYVGIPMPTPKYLIGLECRSVTGHMRKSFGAKTLWILPKNIERFLVTESILDSLAGERLLQDKEISLCSLNGTGNASKVRYLIEQYKPRHIQFALDNDIHGIEALDICIGLCEESEVSWNICKFTGKDLHKNLIGG